MENKIKIDEDIHIKELGLDLKKGDVLRVTESGLNRLYQKMADHDCGTITAFRSRTEDGVLYTKSDNKLRNKSLQAKLMSRGYRLTKVDGYYIENFGKPNAVEVKEDVYFVEDFNDGGDLRSDLEEFGRKFDQDSILFMPKGGLEGILIGTHPKNNYPAIGKEIQLGDKKSGRAGEFMTKIRNKPFFFEGVESEVHLVQGSMGRQALKHEAKKHWSEL